MFERISIVFRPYPDGTTRSATIIEKPNNVSSGDGTLRIQKGKELWVFPLDRIEHSITILKEET